MQAPVIGSAALHRLSEADANKRVYSILDWIINHADDNGIVEVSMSQLTKVFDVTIAMIQQPLQLLEQLGLITRERRGPYPSVIRLTPVVVPTLKH